MMNTASSATTLRVPTSASVLSVVPASLGDELIGRSILTRRGDVVYAVYNRRCISGVAAHQGFTITLIASRSFIAR
jgi:hypothetical protein